MEAAGLRLKSSSDGTRPLFVATIFAGSFLLFLTQPMIAKMALPRLGGAPAVWNSAMLVYQGLLLGGYAYAHWIGRFEVRKQALIQLTLLSLAALWLPLSLSASLVAGATPTIAVPLLLLTSVGPLFFAISAQSPLIQRWFGAAKPGANPYALFAASNLGSFGGLLAYPVLVEPLMSVSAQRLLWTSGYALLVLLVVACAALLPQSGSARPDAPVKAAPSKRMALRWTILAAIPSGLMLSTTSHLTTDIIAMPMIWVFPLALYLLTFTIAFSERNSITALVQRCFPIVLTAGAVTAFGSGLMPLVSALLSLALLFIVGVTLHRVLYDSRPDAVHLTRFYLCTSLGGVLGGAFCALIAPSIFDWVYEHPLLIFAAAVLAPQRAIFGKFGRLWTDKVRAPKIARRFVLTLAVLVIAASELLFWDQPSWVRTVAVEAMALAALFATGQRTLFAMAIAAIMLGSGASRLYSSVATDTSIRSYFGVYQIAKDDRSHTLVHGTTEHGLQLRSAEALTTPTTYYAEGSGVASALKVTSSIFGPDARIAVIGLGAGTLACYKQPAQTWRFYEIDPAIVEIAENPEMFSFLSRCSPGVSVDVGDARLILSTERLQPHDVLVVDAFSSDAVPAHLLTVEAFHIYRQRLSDDGLLLVHITNRFIDLEPVLAAAAATGGWHSARRKYYPDPAAAAKGASASDWVALSQSPASIAKLEETGGWTKLRQRPGFSPWTDDYGSVLPLIMGLK